ncbi:hypothetical protein B484DRAFT_458480 [Ochromonadaceae sp. CCMP2298]|nr:hypothetical protein B484DRAFT_458480 [Ochromonadaceae sp. CCMP2298]
MSGCICVYVYMCICMVAAHRQLVAEAEPGEVMSGCICVYVYMYYMWSFHTQAHAKCGCLIIY